MVIGCCSSAGVCGLLKAEGVHCGRRGLALKAAAWSVVASPAEAPLHKNCHVNEGMAPDGQETQAGNKLGHM